MSERALPPDPADWPRDPFELLGVEPGVSERDLKRAYLRLIRSYKPEHAPVEFRRIRDAYEAARTLTQMPGGWSWSVAPAPTDDSTPTDAPSGPADRPGAASDTWQLASRGEEAAAYRALTALADWDRAGEDDYLRLYWLLASDPALDPSQSPDGWLVQGLKHCGPRGWRLLELLRRSIAADADLALGDRLGRFFTPGAWPALALDVAMARWRVARAKARWGLILADLEALRPWVPELDDAAWARLLIAAAANLAWGDEREIARSTALLREAEPFGHHHRDLSDDFTQVEHAQVIRAGLAQLGGRSGPFSGLFPLLALTWDDEGPEARSRVRSYVRQIARDPIAAIDSLDRIHAAAPAVIGRLAVLLGGFDDDSADDPGVSAAIGEFLGPAAWWDYPAFRPGLLRFCRREAIAPGIVARWAADRPDFAPPNQLPLAFAIEADWPIRHAYQAIESAWIEGEDA